jgi:hypothetical protein
MCSETEKCPPETYAELRDRPLTPKELRASKRELANAGRVARVVLTKLSNVDDVPAITGLAMALLSTVQVKTSITRSDFIQMITDLWDETAEKLAEINKENGK